MSDLAIERRSFLKTSAAAGATLWLARNLRADDKKKAEVRIALIGFGVQAKRLMQSLERMSDVRIVTVCDIWDYRLAMAKSRMRRLKPQPIYINNYKKMLEKVKGIDGVIITTPDFVHHSITNDCLEAGLHVYCEKEMSNDIEKARSMIKTSQRTGKLLQIGHQRRSNPYYLHAKRLLHMDRAFGNILNVSGQWNIRKQVFSSPVKSLKKIRFQMRI